MGRATSPTARVAVIHRRSAPLSTLVLAGLGFGALLLVVACARRPIVEAPMVEADASAAAIARVRDPGPVLAPRDPSALPFGPGERWVGSYTCRQGSTEMAIVFEELRRSDGSKDELFEIEAVFEFRFDGKGALGHAAAEGAARMRGTYDPKTRRLRLVGEEWLDQPPGYALVTLAGSVSDPSARTAATYAGTVEGPGCSSFSARLEGAAPP